MATKEEIDAMIAELEKSKPSETDMSLLVVYWAVRRVTRNLDLDLHPDELMAIVNQARENEPYRRIDIKPGDLEEYKTKERMKRQSNVPTDTKKPATDTENAGT